MDLDIILKKHNISEEFCNAKKMDKENRIFMSDNYIVKLYYPKKYKYYFNEKNEWKRWEVIDDDEITVFVIY